MSVIYKDLLEKNENMNIDRFLFASSKLYK